PHLHVHHRHRHQPRRPTPGSCRRGSPRRHRQNSTPSHVRIPSRRVRHHSPVWHQPAVPGHAAAHLPLKGTPHVQNAQLSTPNTQSTSIFCCSRRGTRVGLARPRRRPGQSHRPRYRISRHHGADLRPVPVRRRLRLTRRRRTHRPAHAVGRGRL